jgi:D-3-phosphoglycerate dehydrogenase
MSGYSFPKEKIKILLLEGVHPAAIERFREAGYSAEALSHALDEGRLCDAVRSVHFLGIRSATQVTPAVLAAAKHLAAVGCFCIGTNQVALEEAARRGVVVFNAPFSNTRSVAELTVAEIVMLARRAAQKSMEVHAGRWDKSARGCVEVRHKTIGIVGYGHIGPQVGLLAEAFGMKVYYYDIVPKLPLGNAEAVGSLRDLLRMVDVVTLHVPETAQTKNMIGAAELAAMRPGSFLLNLSRGSVVVIEALRQALVSGHIAGAAIDVFPEEPKSNAERFESPLCGLENVILTPHIGGSTFEAQRNIGLEVANALIKYSDTGSSTGAVNFPQVELPLLGDSRRILNIHRNVPGVLRDINRVIAEMGGNIQSQYLSTTPDIGYLITDVDSSISPAVKERIEGLDTNIRTRLLF